MSWRVRSVPIAWLSVVVSVPVLLAAIVSRNPDTHGHLWPTLPDHYHRTPVDTVRPIDLEAVLADLPPFEFPRPALLAAAASQEATAGMGRLMPAAEEVQEVTLVETEYGIGPDRVEVRVGVPVVLTVINEGDQVHGLWLPEVGIAEDIRSGKSQTFRFTPEKPGRFRYMCSYALCGTDEEHARMVGFLTVR